MKPERSITAARHRRGVATALAVSTVVLAIGSALVRLQPGHRAAGDIVFAIGVGAVPSIVLMLVTAALPSLVRARLWWAVSGGVAIGLVTEVVLWAQTWLLLAAAGVPADLCPILAGLAVLLFASPLVLANLGGRRVHGRRRVGVS